MTSLTRFTRRSGIENLIPRTPLDAPIVLLLLTALMGYIVAVDPAVSQTKLIWFVVQIAVFYGW